MSHIKLSGEFSPDFLKILPDLEKQMTEEGYDLDQFSISRSSRNAYREMTIIHDYVVQVAGESFSISYTSDLDFLTYFAELCFAPDATTTASATSNPFVAKHGSFLSRAKASLTHATQWLAGDVVSKEEMHAIETKEEPFHDQHRT